MTSAQQVWEFSRAFLDDQEGYIAVLRVFMDETGVHGDAKMVAVAAYVAKPKIWRAWTKNWNAAKRPIKIFHAADCANLYGEFDGWDKDARDRFVAKLLPVIPAHQIIGVIIGVNLVDLTDAFRDQPKLAEMFGTPYTACFQWVIATVMEHATKHGTGERMAFVHEINDFKGEAMRAFEYVRMEQNPRGIAMTLAFGSKADYPPLQSADVLAYEGGKFLRNFPNRPRRAWTALDPDQTRIIALRQSENTMPEFISQLNAFRERLLNQGWDGTVVP